MKIIPLLALLFTVCLFFASAFWFFYYLFLPDVASLLHCNRFSFSHSVFESNKSLGKQSLPPSEQWRELNWATGGRERGGDCLS